MILQLNLKKKWFDLISKGEKLEEYREIKPYWAVRLLAGFAANATDANLKVYLENNKGQAAEFKPFTYVRFQNGWARGGKPAPFVTLAIREIVISEGVPEWGAEPDTKYFVIKLGERLL